MHFYIYHFSRFLHVFFSQWGVLEGLYPYPQCGVVIFPSEFGLQTIPLLVTHNFNRYIHHELKGSLSSPVGTTISRILIHPPIA